MRTKYTYVFQLVTGQIYTGDSDNDFLSPMCRIENLCPCTSFEKPKTEKTGMVATIASAHVVMFIRLQEAN